MLLTDVKLEESAKVLPEIALALAKLPKPTSAHTDRVSALRHASSYYDAALLSKIGPAPASVTETYHAITLRDGQPSTLKIAKPSDTRNPGPLIIVFFSGAFLAGSIEQTSQIARALATLYAATVVSVSYRLAPEHAFPMGVQDAIDGITWAAENATGPLLSADPSRGFILGGASSGANLAAVLSRHFQQPEAALKWKLTGQYISAGQLFPDAHTIPERYSKYWISREQNALAPVLSTAALEEEERALRSDPKSELRFPVNSGTEMGAQPRTYLQACGMDPLRDDALIYDEMLRVQGVPTRLNLYAGCPHAFWLVLPDQPKAVAAMKDLLNGVGWLLGDEEGSDGEIERALGLAV